MQKYFLRLNMILFFFMCYFSTLWALDYAPADKIHITKVPSKMEKFCLGNVDPMTQIHSQHFDNGALYLEVQCQGDQPHGFLKIFYEDGQLAEESSYVNGRLDGASYQYFDNGTLRGEYHYRNGKLDGLQKKYQLNGFVFVEENYIRGLKHGLSIRYDRNNTIIEEGLYEKGRQKYLKDFNNINADASQKRMSIFADREAVYSLERESTAVGKKNRRSRNFNPKEIFVPDQGVNLNNAEKW